MKDIKEIVMVPKIVYDALWMIARSHGWTTVKEVKSAATHDRGWDRCDWRLHEFCCKDLDSGRVWVCEKGFPRLHGKYEKCMVRKGDKVEVCGDFKEPVSEKKD